MPNARMYWLHTLSPTHVGAGRGIGYIDLPLHRDKITNWPLIPGSSFKGVWRDHHAKSPNLKIAFGHGGDDTSNAGALIPTDARLVCLPIRSFSGTFAWCTSPMCLRMLKRDLTITGMTTLPALPDGLGDDLVHHSNETALKEGPKIYLEDLDFTAKRCDTANAWADIIAKQVFDDEAWRSVFTKRFAVVADTVFNFLSETGTQVDARVKIEDDTKTVVDGALWNEESLPAETILAGLVACDAARQVDPKKLFDEFASDEIALQIGGKSTVGRGRVRCVFGGGK